jgi:phage host-nuclease inhibitor protein Gam
MLATRVKKTSVTIPTDLMQAEGYLAKIGDKQRLINTLKRDAKAKKDAIDETLAQDLESVTKERDTLFNALFAFAQSKKKLLTDKLKSVIFRTGATFGWRMTPPRVTVRNGMTDDDLIHYLEKNGLSKYVRIHKEVDREALLRDKPKISVVAYMQHEEFFAKPKLGKGEGRAEEFVKTETETIDVKV